MLGWFKKAGIEFMSDDEADAYGIALFVREYVGVMSGDIVFSSLDIHKQRALLDNKKVHRAHTTIDTFLKYHSHDDDILDWLSVFNSV